MEEKKYVYYQKSTYNEHYLDALEAATKFSQPIFGGWTNMDGEPYEEAVEAWLAYYEYDFIPGIDELTEMYKEEDDGTFRRVYPCSPNSLKLLNDDLDNAKKVNEDGTAESSVEIDGVRYYFKRSAQANKYHELSKKKLAVSIATLRARKKDTSEEGWEDLVRWMNERPLLIGQAATEYEEDALAMIQKGIIKSGIKVILPKNADALNDAILKAGHMYHHRVTNGSIL